jgi:hypothetical protein
MSKYYYEILNNGDDIEILNTCEIVEYLYEFESQENEPDDVVREICKKENDYHDMKEPGSYIVMLYSSNSFIGRFNVELDYYVSFSIDKAELEGGK